MLRSYGLGASIDETPYDNSVIHFDILAEPAAGTADSVLINKLQVVLNELVERTEAARQAAQANEVDFNTTTPDAETLAFADTAFRLSKAIIDRRHRTDSEDRSSVAAQAGAAQRRSDESPEWPTDPVWPVVRFAIMLCVTALAAVGVAAPLAALATQQDVAEMMIEDLIKTVTVFVIADRVDQSVQSERVSPVPETQPRPLVNPASTPPPPDPPNPDRRQRPGPDVPFR